MKQSSNKAIKQYELGHVKHTHDLVVKYEDRQIYRVRDKSHTFRSGAISIELLNETIVAVCKITAFGRGRQLYAGNPNTKEDTPWVDLQNEGDGFGFQFDGKNCAWTKQGKTDYVLLDKTDDQPMMAFVSNNKNLDNPRPALDFFAEMDRGFEQICLAALFSLVKRDKGSLDSMTRLAMGATAGGILIAGGAGGAGG